MMLQSLRFWCSVKQLVCSELLLNEEDSRLEQGIRIIEFSDFEANTVASDLLSMMMTRCSVAGALVDQRTSGSVS